MKRTMVHCKSSLDQGQYLTTYYYHILYSTESCDLYIMYYHEDFQIKLTVLEQAENEQTLRFSRKITNPKLLSEKYQKRLTLSSFLYI